MSASGYVTAIKGIGVEVLAEADLGYYEGDWVGLVKDTEWCLGREYGFIVVGYGSCSGCDEWEGADGPAERAQIIARILGNAKWFESLDEAKAYITSAAATNAGYYVHENDWGDFVRAACEVQA